MSTSQNAAPNEWMESMLGDFLDESGQLLERLNEHLLQLDALVRAGLSDREHGCDEMLLNEMFRSAHSLKGLSAMLGLGDINNLTHRLENVFDAARKDGLTVTGDVVELMFRAVDHLEKLVDGLKDPTAEPIPCDAIIDDIHRLLEANGVERKRGSQADVEKALGAFSDRSDAPASTSELAASAQAPVPQRFEAAPAALSAEDDSFAGVEDEAAISDKYVPIFIDEAGLAIDRLAEVLLTCENGGSRESLTTLLHTAHQLKGSAACIGLNRPAKLAHLMEDILQTVLDSGGTLWPGTSDAMLKCTDALREYLENLKRGRSGTDGFNEAARELLAVRPRTMSAGAPLAERPEQPVAETHAAPPNVKFNENRASIGEPFRRCVEAALPEGASAVVGCVRFQPRLPMAGLKAHLVYERLASLGEVCYFDPPREELDDLEELERVSFGLVTERTAESVREHLRIAGVDELSVEHLSGERPRLPAVQNASLAAGPVVVPAEPRRHDGGNTRAKRPAVDSATAPTETLRVDIERLDELMNLAGQLVISKARFAESSERLKTLRCVKGWGQALAGISAGLRDMGEASEDGWRTSSLEARLGKLQSQTCRLQRELDGLRDQMRSLETIHEALNDLMGAIHQLDRVSDGIQQAVMDTRMIPIGPLFNRFKRVVRDITRANGKDIRLVIAGEKTKLDKRMIDELGDPLIHMVRNSADHGIEPPDVRLAAGKPAQGTITLDAFHRGNHVVIQVRDDGGGLNTDRIRQKCVEKGLLSETEAQRLTAHDIHQMIWAPGLSTAERVTEVSGRGMGMDIVKSKIELLHGTVELDSSPGHGTLISIKLPLTLAILPSLLVDIHGDVFAVPMESVIEIIRVPRDQISTIHGHRTAWVRQRAISVVELGRMLKWTGGKKLDGTPDSGDATIVVIGEARSELGLEVDRVLGEQDAVVKSLTENYRNVTGITGASILGDGRVSLILDVAALIQMAATRAVAAAPSEERT